MKVQFKSSIGARDAQILGVKHSDCVFGVVADLSDDTIKQITSVCGEGIVSSEINAKDIPEEPPAKSAKPAKVEPSDAELDKLTDPKKK